MSFAVRLGRPVAGASQDGLADVSEAVLIHSG